MGGGETDGEQEKRGRLENRHAETERERGKRETEVERRWKENRGTKRRTD